MQRDLDDLVELVDIDTVAALDREPVRHGHQVLREQARVGVGREVPVLQRPLQPVRDAGDRLVAECDRQFTAGWSSGLVASARKMVGQP